MLRITGILCGSALAIAVIILALGIPRLTSDRQAENTTAVEEEVTLAANTEIDTSAVISAADAPATEAIVAAESPTPDTPSNADNSAQEDAVDMEEQHTEVATEPSDAEDQALVDAIFAPVEERTDLATAPLPEIDENWYAFWSPFRSELAANGFVEQLQRTTGLDYRVVKQKIGVYEVAFAYSDERDVASKLATIAAATGLEMPDG